MLAFCFLAVACYFPLTDERFVQIHTRSLSQFQVAQADQASNNHQGGRGFFFAVVLI
jgi:hypothetical protein